MEPVYYCKNKNVIFPFFGREPRSRKSTELYTYL